MAREKGFDLVEVSPTSVPPVCRVMDFGKYKYQMSKKHSAKKTSMSRKSRYAHRSPSMTLS